MMERDFVGYGRNIPKAPWPNGARIAINFAVNYEEGAERSVPDGDAVAERGEMAYPVDGHRDFANETNFEYGSRVGVWRLLDIFAKHDIKGAGSISNLHEIADTWIFPPALTLQYHINGMGAFKPYVGVGLQYINFFDTGAGDNLLGAQKVSIDDAVGFTLQAGLDISLGDGWYLNADVKKTWLDTTVTWRNNAALGGLNVVGDADLDPWIFSGGLGYRFNLFGPRIPEPAPIALK